MLTVGLRAFSGNDPHLPLEIELAFGRADRFANAYSEQQLQLETVAYPLGELRWRVEFGAKEREFRHRRGRARGAVQCFAFSARRRVHLKSAGCNGPIVNRADQPEDPVGDDKGATISGYLDDLSNLLFGDRLGAVMAEHGKDVRA